MPDAAETADADSPNQSGSSGGKLWKVVVGVVVLVAVLFSIRQLPIGEWTAAIEQWVDSLGWWGPAAFIAIYIAASLLLIPASALTIAAGVVFGLFGGFVIVSIASTTSAALALLISRYAAREKIESIASDNPKFAAIDRAITKGGWKIVAMLRLSPAVPFNLLNYMFGLTSIPFWRCVLTSWLAMMPGTLLYVYLGYIGKTAAAGDGKSPLEWGLLGVGIVATLAVTWYLTRLAKRELANETEITDSPRTP